MLSLASILLWLICEHNVRMPMFVFVPVNYLSNYTFRYLFIFAASILTKASSKTIGAELFAAQMNRQQTIKA